MTLKACRVNKELKQIDVARKLKISTQSLTNWETGRQIPRFDIVKRLAELYEVSIDEITLTKKK